MLLNIILMHHVYLILLFLYFILFIILQFYNLIYTYYFDILKSLSI